MFQIPHLPQALDVGFNLFFDNALNIYSFVAKNKLHPTPYCQNWAKVLHYTEGVLLSSSNLIIIRFQNPTSAIRVPLYATLDRPYFIEWYFMNTNQVYYCRNIFGQFD
ncbi:MAG: hypothetical protein U5L45_20890 [Saprospiraceae bacterium]|nr:hypothetical protein [Saprospiraceae bacterium]MDZ7880147.1 hypothetical protein [Saprospiraceae bacterium]